jgi:hypothetical protein
MENYQVIKKCLSVERQPQKPFQFQGNDSGRGTMWKQHFILTGQLEHPKPKNDLKELYSFAKNKLITVQKALNHERFLQDMVDF